MRLTLLLILIISIAPLWGNDAIVSFPGDRSFLPRNWLTAPIDAVIEPLPDALHEKAQDILTTALRKYPAKVRERFLEEIFVVGGLRFYGVGYGGTYLAKGRHIVLVYRESFQAKGFEQRFHHEFSSLLLKQNERVFESVRWTAANKPGFSYRAAGVVEEQTGDRSEATKVLQAEQEKTGGSGSTLLQLDLALMKDGFLTPYNMVSIEQDLNETAAHLFTNNELWELCRRYPRIDQKVDVLIDFYRHLDPSMDRLFFRNLTPAPRNRITP